MGELNHLVRNAIQSMESLGIAVENRAKQLEDEYNDFASRWHIVSPTGRNTIRVDSQGDGIFGASRGVRIHTGIDWKCNPNQDIHSMLNGRVVRIFTVYPGENWQGVEIASPDLICRILYVVPDESLVGQEVRAGDIIGAAQDISQRYGRGMLSYVHAEIFLNYEGLINDAV